MSILADHPAIATIRPDEPEYTMKRVKLQVYDPEPGEEPFIEVDVLTATYAATEGGKA